MECIVEGVTDTISLEHISRNEEHIGYSHQPPLRHHALWRGLTRRNHSIHAYGKSSSWHGQSVELRTVRF